MTEIQESIRFEDLITVPLVGGTQGGIYDIRIMVQNKYKIILFIFLIAVPLVGGTQGGIDTQRNKLGIILINDTLFDTDKDYTGSVGVYYKFKFYPLSIKYQIDAYTPSAKHKELTEPQEGMHPYAGFGYIETEYQILHKNFLMSFHLQLGATGKNSYAKELQNIIHNSLNQFTFLGWDSQIQKKFGYILNPQLEFIYSTKYFTLFPALSVKIGNLLSTQTFRIQLLSGINYNKNFLFTYYSRKPNYNIFLSYKVSNISKNVFLTGFDSYKYGVDIINAISELKIGFDIQYKSYGITFQNHYQSKEYKSQENNSRFSTVILYYIF